VAENKVKLKMLTDWDGGRKKGDIFFAFPDSAEWFEKEKLAEILEKPKPKPKPRSRKK